MTSWLWWDWIKGTKAMETVVFEPSTRKKAVGRKCTKGEGLGPNYGGGSG